MLSHPPFVLRALQLLLGDPAAEPPVAPVPVPQLVRDHFFALTGTTRITVPEHYVTGAGGGHLNRPAGVVFPHDDAGDAPKYERRFERLLALLRDDAAPPLHFVYVSPAAPAGRGAFTVDGQPAPATHGPAAHAVLNRVYDLLRRSTRRAVAMTVVDTGAGADAAQPRVLHPDVALVPLPPCDLWHGLRAAVHAVAARVKGVPPFVRY
jgi:hypothetical protein